MTLPITNASVVVTAPVSHERTAFRLVLLTAVLTLAGFEGSAAILRQRLPETRVAIGQRITQLAALDSLCVGAGPHWPCDRAAIALRRAEVDASVRFIPARERSIHALADLAVALPLLVVLGFYALRWGFTGRVRPLWPLRKTEVP